jgi:putative ABC transport system permease protein
MWLGIRLLWHGKGRLLLSAAGIAVAVAIIFLEQGFFFGVLDSQSRITHLIRGELVLVDRRRTHLNKWDTLERIRIFQSGAIPGIEAVIPVYKVPMRLRNAADGALKRIVVYAFPPDTLPIDLGGDAEQAKHLRLAGGLLFDRRSRAIYGDIRVGEDVELAGRKHRVMGFVDLGPNLINDGAVVMSEGNLRAMRSGPKPIMGVVRLQPGADLGAVHAALARQLPDLDIFTPAGLAAREVRFTATSAPVGIIFGIGMLAGFVIGTIVCYQVLFNEIHDLVPQYATLRAMGFSTGFLGRIVLQQALLYSVAGFAIAMPFVWWLYDFIAARTALVMLLNPERVLTVLGLTVGMCLLAGLVAMRHVWRADPAELY